MMRPTVSPLNASIYGINEASLAPVEDLAALSFEDFESLCRDGAIKPHARNLAMKPHVRLWSGGYASGHVEIERLFSEQRPAPRRFPDEIPTARCPTTRKRKRCLPSSTPPSCNS